MAADLEGLREFVESKGESRGRAEFFVGRKEELEFIESACVQMVRRRTSRDLGARDDEPGVLLFTGPPGMGKSALLAEAQALAQGVPGGEPGEKAQEPPRFVKAIQERFKLESFGTPLVVRAEPGQLQTEESLMKLCALEARRLRDDASMRPLSQGARILADQLDKDDPGGELFGIDALEMPFVVLMINEAQRSDKDNLGIYGMLHLGMHDLPIVTVLTGLSDSLATLQSVGIQRLASGYHVELPMLNDEDCAEAMEAMLERYEIGAPEGERQAWKDMAVEHSARFPHHLNTVLLATAEVIILHGGELNPGMIAEAGQAIGKRKDRYYAELAADFTPEEREVATLVVIWATTQNGRYPETLAGELLPTLTTPRKNKHGDIDIRGFVLRMEHRGMLWRTDTTRYECPIPSFQDWLQRKYGKHDA